VANSLALQLAGIKATTPNPPGGVIMRDGEGQPTGILQEDAMMLANQLIPPPGETEMAAASRAAMQHQLSLGITSATDPAPTPAQMTVYRQLAANGEPSVRIDLLLIIRDDDKPYPLLEKFVGDTLRIDGHGIICQLQGCIHRFLGFLQFGFHFDHARPLLLQWQRQRGTNGRRTAWR
jgi:hypothetical protein